MTIIYIESLCRSWCLQGQSLLVFLSGYGCLLISEYCLMTIGIRYKDMHSLGPFSCLQLISVLKLSVFTLILSLIELWPTIQVIHHYLGIYVYSSFGMYWDQILLYNGFLFQIIVCGFHKTHIKIAVLVT